MLKEQSLSQVSTYRIYPHETISAALFESSLAATSIIIFSKDGIFRNDMIAPFKGEVSLIPLRRFLNLEFRGHEMKGCRNRPHIYQS